MRSALIFALVVSTAAADCHLHASDKTLSASAVIPSITKISKACCTDVQNIVTEAMNNLDKQEWSPSPEEQSQTMQDCASFVGYMMQWKNAHAGMPPSAVEASLPAGFEFKEYVTGEATKACSLHASLGAASVSCDIPASTTMSTECCDVVQGIIDHHHHKLPSPEEFDQDAVTTNCQSVMAWGLQRDASLGPPPHPGNPKTTPEDVVTYVSKALPAGFSCTESTGSGMSSRMLNVVLQVVELNWRSGVQELETQPAASSLLPTIFVAGTAGVLGGLVAFFVVSKLSSKPQRVALISDEA